MEMGRLFLCEINKRTTLFSTQCARALTAAKYPLLKLVVSTIFVFFCLSYVYWPGMDGSFLFDDLINIEKNASLQAFDGSLSSLVVAATSSTSSPLGRPFSMATFALNLHFFGDSPFSFKLTNLVIHMVNAMLVFVLVRQLWQRLGFATHSVRSVMPALWIATAWALHPINLTPVLFVVQRMTSLSAFFILAALALYLYGRQLKNSRGFGAIATSLLLCWPAAILSKETGVLLPIYVFLIEWLVLGTLKSVPFKVKWVSILVLGTAVAGLCWAKWGFITAGYGVRDFSPAERLLTETRVLWFYVRQLLLPLPEVFGLFHDDIGISRGIFEPITTVLAIAAWLAVTVLALQQRDRRPLFAFAVFWFQVSHLLESTILPLEIAYEHRNYLASLGLWVWLASILFPDESKPKWLVPRLVLASSFVFFCGLVTSIRSLQWADELQRTQIEVTHHPDSARANYQAATAMMQRTYESGGGGPLAYQMVQFHYKRAAELDPGSKAALMGMLYLDCAAGEPKNASIQTSLRERFATGRLTFGDRAVVQSLSGLLVENRLCLDDPEVTALIDAALSNPTADGAMRGMIYAVAMDHAAAKMHDIPRALAYAQAAVASNANSMALRVNLIYLYIQSNQVEQARREYLSLTAQTLSLQDKASLNELKIVFETLDKNANSRKPAG